MQILKFGGTSMTDQKTWREVLTIIQQSDSPVVVVSATAKTTRALIHAAGLAVQNRKDEAMIVADQIEERHQNIIHTFFDDNGKSDHQGLIDDCLRKIRQQTDVLRGFIVDIAETGSLSLQSRDAVAGIGEQISSYLLARCGEAIGMNTRFADARDLIKTDSNFGSAAPDFSIIQLRSERISTMVRDGVIPVTGGFIGENERGELTTLGFEGSDYTASILGHVLNAEKITIWTDVSGIYTCDPRVIGTASPIPEISFQQATELAYFGAKILHPSTLKPAEKKKIPVYVKNLFEPDHAGTKIFEKAGDNGAAKAVSYRENGVQITVTSNGTIPGHQFLAEIFERLNRYHASIDVVNTTEASVIIAMEDQQIVAELAESFKAFGEVHISREKGFITVVGLNPNESQQIQEILLKSLQHIRIDLISYSRVKKHLTIVLQLNDLIPSLKAVHHFLFE